VFIAVAVPFLRARSVFQLLPVPRSVGLDRTTPPVCSLSESVSPRCDSLRTDLPSQSVARDSMVPFMSMRPLRS
jgi:hypothetical protein